MFGILARKWWVLALRGLIAAAIGFLALAWPAITPGVILNLFAIFALANGALSTFAGLAALGPGVRWWGALGAGITGLAFGAFTLLNPGANPVALLAIIAAYALLAGLFDLLAAVQLGRPRDIEWLMAVSGLLSMAFGGYLVAFPGDGVIPGAGVLAKVNLIALYAVLYGILALVLAVHIRGLVHDVREKRDVSHPRTRRPSHPGLP